MIVKWGMSFNQLNRPFQYTTDRRSLVVRAADTKSGGRGFKSHIGLVGDFFCDRPQPRVSSAQAQWVGQATDRDSSTQAYGCDFGGGGASRSYDPLGMISYQGPAGACDGRAQVTLG